MAFALAIPLLAFLPFLAWNATVGWENVLFTFHNRQSFDSPDVTRLGNISTALFLVYGLSIVALTWLLALWKAPRQYLVAWTALPLPIVLIALSLSTAVESYWIIGPGASLMVAVGIALARANERWPKAFGIVFGAAAAYTVASALFLTLPEAVQARFLSGPGAVLRGPLASGVFATHRVPARTLRFSYADVPEATFYETACEGLRPDAARVLPGL